MIKNYLLSSAAMFAPPDDLGSGGGDAVSTTDQVSSNDQVGSSEPAGDPSESGSAVPSESPVARDHAKPRVETITDSVKRAIAETKQKAAVADGAPKPPKPQKSSQAAGAAAGDKQASADGNTATAPQAAASGPPQTWSKEEKALWSDVPEAARAAIIRREADTAKGVQELRTRYQEIDTAVAPYRAVMTQHNVTPGQAINQLFSWHMALAGPNKVQAFQQLAKSFGIDISTVAGGQYQPQQASNHLEPAIYNLESRIRGFEEQTAMQTRAAAEQTYLNWSKDKPHAERVRGLMANLITSDLNLIEAGRPQVSNTIKNGSIDMDAAYQAAIYAHPEVRETLLHEDQTKRNAAAKAAAEKARKAGASMRSGAPAGTMSGNQNAAPKVETARESIMRALAEVRGSQH